MTGSNDIQKWFSEMGWIGVIIKLLIMIAITILIVFIVLKILDRFFKKRLRSGNKIQIRFAENVIRVVIIVIAAFWILMSFDVTESFGRVLFQGTAVVTAVVAFAAQQVISDVICGFMLSASKPFDLGDRLELEDGTAGIVQDITMRHVVLRQIDTIDIIIPNSKLNGMVITNMSHEREIRSIHFRFNIAYGSDVEMAKEVIGKAVRESQYSVPGLPNEDGTLEYGPVYFMAYSDSSLVMETTVYYNPESRTEIVKNDINTRVNRALKENGIEIPYNYMNVIVSGSGMKE